MDYTSNLFGYNGNSNSSVKYKSDWKHAPLKLRLKYGLISTLVLFGRGFTVVGIYFLVSTWIFNTGKITNPKLMYYDQKFRAWLQMYGSAFGMHEEIQKIESPVVKFHLSNNLYLEYEISEEARKHIQSIKLLRHMHNFYRYNRWHEIRQNGWDLVFEFNRIPDNSYVGVKHL
jgi:hypothetical protein